MDDVLAKLAPDERSHQACIMKGLDIVRKDKRLRNPDRMKTSIFSQAVLNGTVLTVNGGAVRSNNHWWRLGFKCELTKDLMKATSFTFEIGPEIPKNDWERLGLWG